MRSNLKLAAAAVAVSVAFGSMTSTASAQVNGNRIGGLGGGSGSSAGLYVGGCVFGGAAGLIFAALAKGQAYNNDKIELTRQEAFGIAGTCGLGAFGVISSWRRP